MLSLPEEAAKPCGINVDEPFGGPHSARRVRYKFLLFFDGSHWLCQTPSSSRTR